MSGDYRAFYRGRRVMITGGLGFIGSNLARHLVALDADVLLVDSLIPDYGGNLFNIDGIADRVRVNVADVRQQSTMNYLVRDREIIFNLAGQVSHIDSMRDPYSDLEINCRSQLTILEACRYNNPAVKVVYAGTRQVYATQFLVGGGNGRRLVRHRHLPVLPVAVPDRERDRRTERFTEADARNEFGGVLFDLHACAAAVAALAAAQFGIDVALGNE